MITESKINKVQIMPVLNGGGDDSTIKGFDLFPFKNWITFICSRKKSGKTSLISNIIDKTTNKSTTIYLFCGTYQIDATWRAIIKKLEDRNYVVNCFDSIAEGKKLNNLDIILKTLSAPEHDSGPRAALEKKKTSRGGGEAPLDRFGLRAAPGLKLLNFGDVPCESMVCATPISWGGVHAPPPPPAKKKKPKANVASNLFIFDDISNQLKNPIVSLLLKTHRHSNSNVIVSSQYIHDIEPQSLLQIDALITFKSFSQEKLEDFHRKLDISVPFDIFWRAYQYAISSGKYDFFYVNTRTDEMRKNFNSILNHAHNKHELDISESNESTSKPIDG